MHTGKGYRFGEFLYWTRRTIYVLAVLSFVPVALYQLAGVKWLVIPWGVVFLLGTTVALSAGFKNLQTFNRMQDAQQVWGAIVSLSRVWGMACRDGVAEPDHARRLVYRHLAWLAALRHQMRERRAWEHQGLAKNVEYRKQYRIPEHEHTLESELLRYLSDAETSEVVEADRPAMQVLGLQARDVRAFLDGGGIALPQFNDLEKLIRDMVDQQSRSERIKNFPYPRQHAFINTTFVRILCLLLPFGMIGEFERLNGLVDGWAKGHMVWFAVPLSLLISWMYTSLDQVGEGTENPFEGGSNDVPISRMCEEIELELRQMLGEEKVPLLASPDSDIVV